MVAEDSFANNVFGADRLYGYQLISNHIPAGTVLSQVLDGIVRIGHRNGFVTLNQGSADFVKTTRSHRNPRIGLAPHQHALKGLVGVVPYDIASGVDRNEGAVLSGDDIKAAARCGNKGCIVDPSRQRGLASHKKPQAQGRLAFEGKGGGVLGGTYFVENTYGLGGTYAQSQLEDRVGRLVFQLGQARGEVMDQDTVGCHGQIDGGESSGVRRLIHGDLGSRRSSR